MYSFTMIFECVCVCVCGEIMSTQNVSDDVSIKRKQKKYERNVLKMAYSIIYLKIFSGQSGREWYNKRERERYSLDILKNSSAARCQQKEDGGRGGREKLLIASVEFKRLAREREREKKKKTRKVGFRLYPSFQPWHSYRAAVCVHVDGMLRFDWKDLSYIFTSKKKNNNKIFLSILAERKERQLNFCISETWETNKKKNGIPPLLSTSIVHEKKMCVLVTSISKSKKNPASFSNVTFPACFIFPVQCDPRIAERSDERNVSGERERDIFSAACSILTECHFWFSLSYVASSRKIPPPPMDVMAHNLEQNNKRFFKLCMYSICKLQWISTKRDRIICGIFIQEKRAPTTTKLWTWKWRTWLRYNF